MLNCMVNRDLTRRVKLGQEVAWASRAVHSDLHLILRLVKTMDQKAGLWEHVTTAENAKVQYACKYRRQCKCTHPKQNCKKKLSWFPFIK